LLLVRKIFRHFFLLKIKSEEDFINSEISTILIVALVAIVVFLVTREFWCWYWKINEIRDLLKSINLKMESSKEDKLTKDLWYCEKCGTENSLSEKTVKNVEKNNLKSLYN